MALTPTDQSTQLRETRTVRTNSVKKCVPFLVGVRLLAALILCSCDKLQADGAEQEPAAEVTLKGSLVCNGATVPDLKNEDHTMAIFAIDGTPAVRDEVESIIKEFYPDEGLDADAAEILMDQFSARLKFFISPDSPALQDPKYSKNKGSNHYCMPATPSAVTGVVTERDGRKWIAATRIEPVTLKFPDRMLAVAKPHVVPDQDPLTLKISETLSLKCMFIPPGRFLMGTPVYMWPYYVEEYPHVVTLTKPVYMAEIPVTQEMYEAVMNQNPSTVKKPELPVQNPAFADVNRFCQLVSEKNGRKVRLPTDAEWEYAARTGTSDPGFPEKYKEQNSTGPEGFKFPLPVKSRKPNAWGLYDMASCWWEITGNKGQYNVRHPETDPFYPPGVETARSQRSGRGIVQSVWSIGTHEFITEKADYTGQKFRVVVEVE
jgi:formylglycine-generating enzyme required for sulfatase activity